MNAYPKIAEAGATVTWLHSVYRILVTPDQTGGALGMFSAIGAPNSGPPRHIHYNEDEIIHVVEGEVEFWLDGSTRVCGAGETVVIPRGKPHSFHILSQTPARFVTVLTPGGFEGFFPAVARQGLQIPRHMKEIAALGRDYGCEFTGPPLRAA